MNFDRLRAVGAAVAAGAIMAVAGSSAQANTAWYSSGNTVPSLQAVIDSIVTGYKVTLSTTMGSADYLGFGFNWTDDSVNAPALKLSDFTVKSAYTPPGSSGGTSIDVNSLDTYLCGDGMTKVNKCDPNGNNFNGGGSATNFDYIFGIGTQGAASDWIDEVTFEIASMAAWNPFSQLAARAQSTTSDPDPEKPGSGSVKADLLLCTTPDCNTFQNPPVPEISATGSVAALGSVLALMAFLLERRGGVSMRRRSLA